MKIDRNKSYHSPNFDERKRAIDMIVLHYTGMKTAQEVIDRLRDPEAKVSAHYVIDEEVPIYRLVDESKRAWHAGVSHWRGIDNVNHNSIGIEIVNPGRGWGHPRNERGPTSDDLRGAVGEEFG